MFRFCAMGTQVRRDSIEPFARNLIADPDDGNTFGADKQREGIMNRTSGLRRVLPSHQNAGEASFRNRAPQAQHGHAGTKGDVSRVRQHAFVFIG